MVHVRRILPKILRSSTSFLALISLFMLFRRIVSASYHKQEQPLMQVRLRSSEHQSSCTRSSHWCGSCEDLCRHCGPIRMGQRLWNQGRSDLQNKCSCSDGSDLDEASIQRLEQAQQVQCQGNAVSQVHKVLKHAASLWSRLHSFASR